MIRQSNIISYLIFCPYHQVCRDIRKAGVYAMSIHGDKSQMQREKALFSFTKGDQVNILVATDVAARGT